MRGAGREVLLLHGYGSDANSFYYQINALAESGFKAVAPDMPAFGGSAPITSPWSVGDYADWLKKFIQAMRLEEPYILAHSFGARVAIKLLGGGGAGAKKLLITGGAGIVKPRSPEYIRKVKRYRRIKRFFPRYAEKHFGSGEYRSLSPLMKESYKLIVNEDLKSYAKNITVPTMLIYGKDDKTTPPNEEGETFRSCIAGSDLKTIAGGHFCFCENAGAFNGLMLDFFNDGLNKDI